MDIKPLYRYEREGGGITDSPIKPDCECTERVRLIADKGKALTKDGEKLCRVIDVDSAEGWYEVDAPERPKEARR